MIKCEVQIFPMYKKEPSWTELTDFLYKLGYIISDWKNIDDLIPVNFTNKKNLKRSGKAGIFAGSLELVKEGNIKMINAIK